MNRRRLLGGGVWQLCWLLGGVLLACGEPEPVAAATVTRPAKDFNSPACVETAATVAPVASSMNCTVACRWLMNTLMRGRSAVPWMLCRSRRCRRSR